MNFFIEVEQEEDGRWLAEITDLPSVMAYGVTEEETKANAYALALRAGHSVSSSTPILPSR